MKYIKLTLLEAAAVRDALDVPDDVSPYTRESLCEAEEIIVNALCDIHEEEIP